MLYQNKYRVESTRLKGWDYGNDGYYFVTICVKNKVCLLGQIEDGIMVMSELGKIAEKYWLEIPAHFGFAKLDEFIIMPNHIHGIIVIDKNVDNANNSDNGDNANNVETRHCLVSTDINKNANVNKSDGKPVSRFQNQGRHNLSAIIGSYKSICTKTINRLPEVGADFQWQPRFYDHIIRDEKGLLQIRNYIHDNPLEWNKDQMNPTLKSN